jgi:hypothetical protein
MEKSRVFVSHITEEEKLAEIVKNRVASPIAAPPFRIARASPACNTQQTVLVHLLSAMGSQER